MILWKTTKVIKIRDVTDIELEKKAEDLLHNLKTESETQISLRFKGLGISLISPLENQIIEPLYIYFENVAVVYSMNDFITNYQLQINYINIDNNCLYETPFPVLLTPSYFKKIKNNVDTESMLNIVLRRKNESTLEMQMFDFIGVDIRAFTVGIDDFQV